MRIEQAWMRADLALDTTSKNIRQSHYQFWDGRAPKNPLIRVCISRASAEARCGSRVRQKSVRVLGQAPASGRPWSTWWDSNRSQGWDLQGGSAERGAIRGKKARLLLGASM